MDLFRLRLLVAVTIQSLYLSPALTDHLVVQALAQVQRRLPLAMCAVQGSGESMRVVVVGLS